MPNLQPTLGPFFVGAFFSLYLSGFIATQVATYFRFYPWGRDKRLFFVAVALLFVLDLLGTICSCYTLFYYGVTRWGDEESLLKSPWSFALNPTIVGITTFIVQCSYSYRVWVVNSHKYVLPVFIDAHRDGRKALLSERRTSSSPRIINAIIQSTLENNAITAVWAMLDLIIFASQSNNWHIMVNVTLPKLYVLSILASMNGRHEIARSVDDPTRSTRAATILPRIRARSRSPAPPKSQNQPMSVIVTLDQTTTVEGEDGERWRVRPSLIHQHSDLGRVPSRPRSKTESMRSIAGDEESSLGGVPSADQLMAGLDLRHSSRAGI